MDIGKFYQQNYSKLLRRTTLAVGENNAEDVLGQAFIKAVAYGCKDPIQNWDAWFRTVLGNCIKNFYAKKEKEVLIFDNDQRIEHCIEDVPDISEVISSVEELEEMFEAINEMPKDKREILFSYFIDSATSKEISERLGISEGQIKSVIRRFRLDL